MLLSFAYTPYLWPVLTTTTITALLACYGRRRRAVPGAAPFSVALFLCLPWEVAASLELAAVGPEARIFWFKAQGLWAFPSISAGLWFALAYADLRRWLVWPTAACLAIVPGLHFLLVFAAPGWVWTGFRLGAKVEPIRGPFGSFCIGYGLLLSVASLFVFGWLCACSTCFRKPTIRPTHAWI
jgi:hypothetical protein